MQPLGPNEIRLKWAESTRLENRQKIIDRIATAFFVISSLTLAGCLFYLIGRKIQNYSIAKTALHTLVPTAVIVVTLMAGLFFTRNLREQTFKADRELVDTLITKIEQLPPGTEEEQRDWIIANILGNNRDWSYAEGLLRRLTWGQNKAHYVVPVKQTLQFLRA